MMTGKNRLADEQTPFLQRNAQSRVHWHPWSDQAFREARERDVPIFLSIGNNSSHWCRVMELQCFDNEKIVELLNESYVSIKVDGEERPDVAKIYMLNMRKEHILNGEMPSNFFLCHDLKQFMGGCFYGSRELELVLRSMKNYWDDEKERDVLIGGSIYAFNNCIKALPTNENNRVDHELLKKSLFNCAKKLASVYNESYGGFGSMSYFPKPVVIQVMLNLLKKLKETRKLEDASEILEMVSFSLKQIAMWGIRDHLGGGFHRLGSRFRFITGYGRHPYSNECWPVPHFEKMLYDQAQLAKVYLYTFASTKDCFYSRLSQEILHFLMMEMRGEEGQFFASISADSIESDGGEKEGAFYLWTAGEVEDILQENATIFMEHYSVQRDGNLIVSKFSDINDDFFGKNVLMEKQDVHTVRSKQWRKNMEKCKYILLKARYCRKMPNLDNTVIVAWNGLIISCFAIASNLLHAESVIAKSSPAFGSYLTEPYDYIEVAENAAIFVKEHLFNKVTGRIGHSMYSRSVRVDGLLDDYAFLISGLLDLYQNGGKTEWLTWAMELQDKQDELFWDTEKGGYFNTTSEDLSVIIRVKENLDGAEPSGNSISIINLLKLWSLTNREKYRQNAEDILILFGPQLAASPEDLPLMCCGVEMFYTQSTKLVIIVGCFEFYRKEYMDMLKEAYSSYDPNILVVHVDTSEVSFWEVINPDIACLAKETIPFEGVVARVRLGNSDWSLPILEPRILKCTLFPMINNNNKDSSCYTQWKPSNPNFVPSVSSRIRFHRSHAEELSSKLELMSEATGANFLVINNDNSDWSTIEIRGDFDQLNLGEVEVGKLLIEIKTRKRLSYSFPRPSALSQEERELKLKRVKEYLRNLRLEDLGDLNTLV